MMQRLLRRQAAMRGFATARAARARVSRLLLFPSLTLLPSLMLAQAPIPAQPVTYRQTPLPGRPLVWNCFGSPDGPMRNALPAHRSGPSDRSYFGKSFTPRGDLRVLVIYAGFTGDNDVNNSSIPQNNTVSNNPWPQQDASHPVWGTSLPASAYDNSLFYSDYSQFSPNSTDNNISNVLYQMSRFSPNGPFRLIVESLPNRVNIPTATLPADTTWPYYQARLWDQVKLDYPTFDWSRFDQRTNYANFASDNSVSPPDGRLDFVIVVWRMINGGPYGRLPLSASGAAVSYPPTSGLVPLPGSPFASYETGMSYTSGSFTWDGITHTFRGGGIDRFLTCHELLHCMIEAPHYNYAHGVNGPHLHGSFGMGFMNGDVTSCLNAWERWYLGWSTQTTGAPADNAHLEGPQDLNATGLYTIRDFDLTGDAVRVRIPNSDQYLWLANHTSYGRFGRRYSFLVDGRSPAQPIPQTSPGLFAMIEDMHTPDLASIVNIGDFRHVNAMRPVSSRGNFDYFPDGALSPHQGYLYGNRFYDLIRGPANAFGGQGDIQVFRWDTDNNGEITINPCTQSCENEGVLNGKINGALTPAYLGTTMAFSTVGQKFGLMTNPGLIPHTNYDYLTSQSAVIRTHGLSVEIVQILADESVVIKVRFDDTEMTASQRWTGDISLEDLPGTIELHVQAGVTLQLDKSGTVNRHTLNPATNEFVNPSNLTCQPNTMIRVENTGTLRVQNGSTLTLQSNARLELLPGSYLIVESGGTVVVEEGAVLVAASGTQIQVGQDARIIVKNGSASAGLRILNGARLTLSSNGRLEVQPGKRFDWLTHFGPASGLTLQDDASELLIQGTLQTAPNLPFTFAGRGFITFDGPAAALTLGSGSNWVQSGPARANTLYRFLNGAQIAATTPRFALNLGKLTYANGSGLTVTCTGTTPATLSNVELAGAGAASGSALTCTLSAGTNFQATSCLIHDLTNGPVIHGAAHATVQGCFVHSIANVGLRFRECTDAVISGGYVKLCDVGVANSSATLHVKTGSKINNNRVGISSFPPPNQSHALVIIGEDGCAQLIDNPDGAIIGEDTWLDLDGPHRQTECEAPINRFDGSYTPGLSYIFNIRYHTPPPAYNLEARRNYWGYFPNNPTPYEPVAASSGTIGDYRLTNYTIPATTYYALLTSQPTVTPPIPPVDCVPRNCLSCTSDDPCSLTPGDHCCEEPERVAGTATPHGPAEPSISLQLSPNPARDLVTLAADKPGTYFYRMLSAQGATISTGEFNGRAITLSIASWPPGPYSIILWLVGTTKSARQFLIID